MGHHNHMGDERLFDAYLARQAGDTLDPRIGEHLTDCETCAQRYDDLRDFMDGLRADADADVELVFPTEWLRHQRQEIARRLENVDQFARIIRFPRHGAAVPVARTSLQTAPRWIAVAAAAGLFVGAAVGSLYDASWRPVGWQTLVSRAAPPAIDTVLASPVAVAMQADLSTFDDDTFLSELELAVDGPRCRELQTFDALTPAVGDARVVQISY